MGWDWLSLQLDDNTELMLYRLRHKDGSVDPFSSGTYVDANGKTTFLGVRDFTMTPMGETYTSPITKAVYPIALAGDDSLAWNWTCNSRRLLPRRNWRAAAAPGCPTGRARSISAEHDGGAPISGRWLSGDDRVREGAKDGG